MKFLLKPGETIETLTPGELSELLARVADRFTESPDETYSNPSSVLLSGAGTAAWIVAEVPAGFQLKLGYITFDADGYTPGAPYTANQAYIDLHRDDVNTPRLDWTPSSTLFPSRFFWGTTDAPVLRASQQLIAQVVNGPPGRNINAYVQGLLEVVRDPMRRP